MQKHRKMGLFRGGLAVLLAAQIGFSVSCADGGSNACGSDKDCNLGEVCSRDQCVPYNPPTKAPQQVFDGWASALANNDLEGSLSYWTPGLREKVKGWITNPELLYSRNILPVEVPLEQALPYIARQLQGAKLIPVVEKGDYLEYLLEKNCTSSSECPRQAACGNGRCATDQKIIFDKLYDTVNQKDVLKIRSF